MAGSPQGQVLTAMALAAILAGCTGLPQTQVECPNMYLLVAKPIGKAARIQRELVMEVTAPSAWPGFDTFQMAYVQRPYAVEYFVTSRWARLQKPAGSELVLGRVQDDQKYTGNVTERRRPLIAVEWVA
jgi:ABC-type uncharacterized transport system auxiliary subunit